MSQPGPRRFTFFRLPGSRGTVLIATVTALLSLFWWQAVSASRLKSQTSDELPHLAAGFVYDHFGDFRFQPENGNLPQRVQGLAGVAVDARFPTDPALWSHSAVWQLGWDYLYGVDNPTDRIVQSARGLNALFGVALGLLIFLLTRVQFGDFGGLLALAFFTFAPNFLTHSALATSDVCASLFLTLAPCVFWWHLRQRTLASGALAGLVTGLTLVAKFNGLLVVPVYALLGVADIWLHPRPDGSSSLRRFGANVALGLGQAAAATAVIWAFYNFRFSARTPELPAIVGFSWDWNELAPALGWKRPILEALLHLHLLPEAWLYGLNFVLAAETARPAFFMGEHSQYGWWQFFPTLVLTKTPVAMLGALALSLLAGVFAWRRALRADRRRWLTTACPIVLTAFVVWIVALRSNLNIGDRHILPVYPALFIALGILASRRWLAVARLALLAGQAAASWSVRPHYMASFNTLAGGPAHGYRLFVDSSLDWGQDLPTLRTWLAANRRPGEKFYFGYFGSAWAPHYGVRPDHFLPAINYVVRPPHVPYELEPGLYCVSATLLAEVYSATRGPWTAGMEKRWQSFRTSPPPPDKYEDFDLLRFARLCKYLQVREPDADAGHSILIYRLTADEIRAALGGPVTGAYRMRRIEVQATQPSPLKNP
ncbi:MAG: phospholipid carrier-dependent glycosyltransferase [Verrucomicrobia bacterium]|nr:phospholipid carrier-dependent glycosyltransferase [Verrucomicrobiota bacterium]